LTFDIDAQLRCGADLRDGPFFAEMDAMKDSLACALDAALIVMQSGGSTAAAERSFSDILAGARREATLAIWRLDFIAANSIENPSNSVLRPVGPIGVNLARASAVAVLSDRVAKGEADVAALESELVRIRTLPSPYGRWLTIAAAGVSGAAFSQLSGGDLGSLAIAFVAASIGQLLRSFLQVRKVAIAPMTLICGVLSGFIASIGLRLGLSQAAPAALIASVIYMVPGLPLINGFADLVSHKYLIVGLQRIANAVFLFLILAIAIVLAHTVVM
jgi:uncharacterized membrane protein YjjP (DUF1212 family)